MPISATKSATTRLMHRSKTSALFDHLVSTDGQSLAAQLAELKP
jgi:hypothetical protein